MKVIFLHSFYFSFVQGDLEADPSTLFELGDAVTDATDILHLHYFPEPTGGSAKTPLEGSTRREREMLSPSQTTAPPAVCPPPPRPILNGVNPLKHKLLI